MPDAVRRPLALCLVVGTAVAFAVLAAAVWGVPGLWSAWPVLTMAACLLSIVLLVAFWDVWLVLGLAIDLGLLAVAATRPGWVAQVLS